MARIKSTSVVSSAITITIAATEVPYGNVLIKAVSWVVAVSASQPNLIIKDAGTDEVLRINSVTILGFLASNPFDVGAPSVTIAIDGSVTSGVLNVTYDSVEAEVSSFNVIKVECVEPPGFMYIHPENILHIKPDPVQNPSRLTSPPALITTKDLQIFKTVKDLADLGLPTTAL